jgi:hypothetical protein
MKLSELYLREIYLRQFCEELEESFTLQEEATTAALSNLLKKAEKTIFPRFGIKSSDAGKYFIAGSARLHLYPQLSAILNDKIGDLDIIIPGKKEWEYLKQYLEKNNLPYNKEEYAAGIYRPQDTPEIEAFTVWDPSKADPSKFKDSKVTSTEQLLRTSNRKPVGGYYFMSMFDVIDYKMKLNRDKEKAVTNLLFQYIDAKSEEEKQKLRDNLIKLFSGDETAVKSFLAPTLSKQIK